MCLFCVSSLFVLAFSIVLLRVHLLCTFRGVDFGVLGSDSEFM